MTFLLLPHFTSVNGPPLRPLQIPSFAFTTNLL
jgi:hypothetical protein